MTVAGLQEQSDKATAMHNVSYLAILGIFLEITTKYIFSKGIGSQSLCLPESEGMLWQEEKKGKLRTGKDRNERQNCKDAVRSEDNNPGRLPVVRGEAVRGPGQQAGLAGQPELRERQRAGTGPAAWERGGRRPRPSCPRAW